MTDTPDTSPEAVERVKSEAMTLEAHGTLWVSADDYATLAAERDALKARAESAEAKATRLQALLDAADAWAEGKPSQPPRALQPKERPHD